MGLATNDQDIAILIPGNGLNAKVVGNDDKETVSLL